MHKRLAIIALFVLLISPPIFPASYISALNFFIFLLIVINPIGNKNDFFVIKRSLPIIMIVIFGIHGLFSYDIYDCFKDIWYIINPLFFITTGYLLMIYIEDINILFRTIIVSSVSIAIYHISFFALNPDLFFKDYIFIRNSAAGRGYYLVPIGLAFVFFVGHQAFASGFWKKLFLYFSGFALVASLFLSFSRSLTLVFAILFFSKIFTFSITVKKIKYLYLGLFVLIAGFTVLQSFSFDSPYLTEKSFLEKVIRSVDEIWVSDYDSYHDINLNWRGYESYKGLEAYRSGGILNILFGRGIGFNTDIGLYILLGNEEFRYIPRFHNGYVYVLVKAGFFGLVMYLLFLFRLFTGSYCSKFEHNDIYVLVSRLAIGICLVLFVTTFFISGYFNKSALLPMLIILGSCLCCINNCLDGRVGNYG